MLNKLSTADADKNIKAILEKMSELNRLLTSLIPPTQRETISKYVEIMVQKVTDTAFDLMGKTVSVDKDLSETRKALMTEAMSSWIDLIKKYEELSLYAPPVATPSIGIVIDKAMELGMKIGAITATGTIDAREKVKKKIMENLKKAAREKGYYIA